MIMKKFRFLSVLTALALTVSAAVPFGFASELPAETTAPVVETAPPVAAAPVMPEGFAGDASVEFGSHSLDARKPLTDTDDYKGTVKAALLYDLDSDTLVFAQNIDDKLYPASLTKIMTCLMTIEMQSDLDAVVTVTKDGLKGQEPGGSTVYLQVGEEMTVRDLLYCLMVKSGNDAASVLATHNSGSIEAFVEDMNRRAQELGCTGTHFANPHGLHHDEHYTTARDMAKITAEAMKHPIFEEIFTTSEYTVPATNLSAERVLETTNYLIRSNGHPIVLDSRVLGGKTGNTSKAGRCLVTLSQKDGMRLLSVVLGAEAVYGANRYTFVRYGNFEETTGLLNFAYKNFTSMQVLNPTQVGCQYPVTGGENHAFGVLTEGMSSTVPLGSSYEALRYEYTLKNGSLTAPVAKDQPIGVVRVWYGDICLAQRDLLSAADVAVEEIPVEPQVGEQDDSVGLWDGILKIILGALAVMFGLFLVLRIGSGIKRMRRRRRKAAAKARQRRR